MPQQPVNKRNYIISPLEKAIKKNIVPQSPKYSKNVHNQQEKKISASLFPQNSKNVEKLSFYFDAQNRFYRSFRQDYQLEVHGKILVNCITKEEALTGVPKIIERTFHLNEKYMDIYLNNGFIKFIKNIKCTFNNNVAVNCDTLAFQDFPVFPLYHDIESSLVPSTDQSKLSNLLLCDIPSQFELKNISNLISGESKTKCTDTDTNRIFKTPLPIYPFRSSPQFYKNRMKSAEPLEDPVCNFFLKEFT